MTNVMELKNVSIAYGSTQVLHNISLEFPQKRITALLGPSGCGKTTLLKALNRLLEEETEGKVKGEIFFQGKNIQEIPSDYLRKKIGIVFQVPTPFPFSIYKNMAYALKYHNSYSKKELEEVIIEKLKLTGLYEEVRDRMHMPASKLSGGQQQRLCIARSLTLNPDLILLDEPCSSLDPNSMARIEETLVRLSEHVSIIIVTHNLGQARRIAHNSAFLWEGELMEYRSTEELFFQPEKEKTKNYLEGYLG
ncbi:MAG: phosphate ABC transporter ATP-binding protein [Candidatus Syntrophonatronum acetioxidans]|uniref:Phosphate ABC transporter ATP-binding protein n=1 Tax=Candidatus Syntrophonatronum acetioxidans TaxID=1795816 RepID=A0A424YG08_9FIRM|nr:MAG: phosphate ABC transporter ATP-binding protein [Candidatus Syntrophonatronum acetioxidans]